MSRSDSQGAPELYHGTKADLKPGDLIEPGYASNYAHRKAAYVYLTATLNAATWGAELASGEGRCAREQRDEHPVQDDAVSARPAAIRYAVSFCTLA